MKLLYFDCFNGASGDMILGALLDAGLPLDDLRRALGSLGVEDYELAAERVLRAGVSATQFQLIERGRQARHDQPAGDAGGGHSHGGRESPESRPHADVEGLAPHTHAAGDTAVHRHGAAVTAPHAHPPTGAHVHRGPGATATHSHAHRSVAEILALIERSALSPGGRARARQLFERLAEAEAADTPDARRAGAPPRGRRARLDHRHRRRRVRHRVVRGRADRGVADERRRGNGAIGPRGLPGAGAGHGAAAGRRADLLERRAGRAADAHGRAAVDGPRRRIRARAVDASRAGGIRRWYARASGYPQRASGARRRERASVLGSSPSSCSSARSTT